ncbi:MULTISPECIES: hypothetical protein [unclassified Nocardioides]|uniref:hypothetical protein n=1 Tax=unclassified Nocardioides TaxID=2615069 RepID=UPI003014F80D
MDEGEHATGLGRLVDALVTVHGMPSDEALEHARRVVHEAVTEDGALPDQEPPQA